MTIGALNPIANPNAWDVFTIQGQDTPGYCEVTGFKRAVEWDVKSGKGTAGATETVNGLPPAKGTVKFYAWRVSDFTRWDIILPLLKYDPTKKTKQANEVFYPSLADINVSSVNIESIGAWEHQGGGMYTREIEMLEFAPAPNASAVATPTSADGGASTTGTSPDPATVALQKQVADLTGAAAKAYNP